MAKRNMGLIIGLVAVVVIFLVYKGGSGTQSIYGTETMTRTAPSTVQPGQTFTLTYTAIGVSGMWGATIVESATGGCTFPSGGSTYQSAMLSDDGLTKTVSITAPQSGSCTFSGDYKFGTYQEVAFQNSVVTICSPQCTDWSIQGPCATSMPNGCGGTCTRTVTRNSLAPNQDTNCDQQIDRVELGVAITDWTEGTIDRNALGSAIQAWAGG